MQVNREKLVQALKFIEDITHDRLRPKLFDFGTSDNAWNRSMTMREAVEQDRLLFWIDTVDERGNFAYDKLANNGGPERVDKSIGFTLIPSPIRGKPGMVTSVNSDLFVIGSVTATQRHNQLAACDVLAQAIRPEVLGPVVEREYLSPLREGILFGSDWIDNTSWIQDFTPPNVVFSTAPWNTFRIALDQVLGDAKTHNLTAAQKADAIISSFRTRYADAVIIE